MLIDGSIGRILDPTSTAKITIPCCLIGPKLGTACRWNWCWPRPNPGGPSIITRVSKGKERSLARIRDGVIEESWRGSKCRKGSTHRCWLEDAGRSSQAKQCRQHLEAETNPARIGGPQSYSAHNWILSTAQMSWEWIPPQSKEHSLTPVFVSSCESQSNPLCWWTPDLQNGEHKGVILNHRA